MKTHITITVDLEIYENLKSSGVNISKTINELLKGHIIPKDILVVDEFQQTKEISDSMYKTWYNERQKNTELEEDAIYKAKVNLYNTFLNSGMNREEARSKAGLPLISKT